MGVLGEGVVGAYANHILRGHRTSGGVKQEVAPNVTAVLRPLLVKERLLAQSQLLSIRFTVMVCIGDICWYVALR